jgi:endonuclease/exonuclease/phosphatase (EEP) superfamily protein YafD
MVRSERPPCWPAKRLLWIRLIIALATATWTTVQPGDPAAFALTGIAENRDATGPTNATIIVVLTANLGNGLAASADVASFLREQGADLVALQEVTAEVAEMLETDLGDFYPYREVRGLGIPGKALLSRYPITHTAWLELNPERPDLLATVDLAGRSVDVLVAHPPPPELRGVVVLPREGAVEQFDRIIEIASDAEHPFLLVGDLNIIPLHQRHRDLEDAGLTDIFGAAGEGPGFTFPERLPPLPERLVRPFMRIDYVWASDDWQAQSAFVGEDTGSDHRPVIAHIALTNSSVAPDMSAGRFALSTMPMLASGHPDEPGCPQGNRGWARWA